MFKGRHLGDDPKKNTPAVTSIVSMPPSGVGTKGMSFAAIVGEPEDDIDPISESSPSGQEVGPSEKVHNQNVVGFQSDSVVLVDITLIDEPEVRQRHHYSKQRIADLATSIMQQGDGDPIKGQLQPVIIMPSPTHEGRYIMVEGLTRLKAFQTLHLSKYIKSIIRSDLDLAAAYRMGYKCNEERSQLTDYDKGMSFAQALEKGLYTSSRALARELEEPHQRVHDLLTFSKLPASVISVIEATPEKFGSDSASRLYSLANKGATDEFLVSTASKISSGSISQSKLKDIAANFQTTGSEQKRSRKAVKQIPSGRIRYGAGTLGLEVSIPAGMEEILAQELAVAFDSILKAHGVNASVTGDVNADLAPDQNDTP